MSLARLRFNKSKISNIWENINYKGDHVIIKFLKKENGYFDGEHDYEIYSDNPNFSLNEALRKSIAREIVKLEDSYLKERELC